MRTLRELVEAAYETILSNEEYNFLVDAMEQARSDRDCALTDPEFMAADSEYALLDNALNYQDDLYSDYKVLKDEGAFDEPSSVPKPVTKSKYAFNISINGTYLAMQDFDLAASNKYYAVHNVVDDTQHKLQYKSADPIYIDIPDMYNIFNYNNKEFSIKEFIDGELVTATRTKVNARGKDVTYVPTYPNITKCIMNLIALGHYVVLCTNGKEYPIGTPSLKRIDVYVNEQLDYLTNQYKNVNELFYVKHMLESYGSRDNARAYFDSKDWRIAREDAERYFTLNNLIRDTLLDIQQDNTLVDLENNNIQREYNILLTAADLDYKLPVIHDYDLIPNQDTSAPLTQEVNYRIKFEAQQLGKEKEYGKPYVTSGTQLFITEADLMEQSLVNAYYYSEPTLRVPTELELEAEYEELRAEYEDLCKEARQVPQGNVLNFDISLAKMKVTLKAKRWNKSGKYARYLELHDHFNTVLHSMLQG